MSERGTTGMQTVSRPLIGRVTDDGKQAGAPEYPPEAPLADHNRELTVPL